jgi:hypothetical protein
VCTVKLIDRGGESIRIQSRFTCGVITVVFHGVTVVLQWCYSGVTVVLQWCYSGVTVVLQWCYSGGESI